MKKQRQLFTSITLNRNLWIKINDSKVNNLLYFPVLLIELLFLGALRGKKWLLVSQGAAVCIRLWAGMEPEYTARPIITVPSSGDHDHCYLMVPLCEDFTSYSCWCDGAFKGNRNILTLDHKDCISVVRMFVYMMTCTESLDRNITNLTSLTLALYLCVCMCVSQI